MPFKSARQRAYLFANHPRLARKWARKYGYKIKRGKKKK